MLDNLNTHFRKCFDDVLGSRATARLLRRVEFHYTPKHASWLNMAEIEIGILSRQCLDGALPVENFWNPKSTPGSRPATRISEPSSGTSLDRMRI